MNAEMGNAEGTEMQFKFQDSRNLSVFITTQKLGRTGLNLTPANDAVITRKFWVLNEPWQKFARVVWLGHNRVPHTCLLNSGPCGYDNHPSDLHQLSGVAKMNVLHRLMSQRNIMTSRVNDILDSVEDDTKALTEHNDTFPADELSS